jgi:hypothetical protein
VLTVAREERFATHPLGLSLRIPLPDMRSVNPRRQLSEPKATSPILLALNLLVGPEQHEEQNPVGKMLTVNVRPVQVKFGTKVKPSILHIVSDPENMKQKQESSVKRSCLTLT